MKKMYKGMTATAVLLAAAFQPVALAPVFAETNTVAPNAAKTTLPFSFQVEMKGDKALKTTFSFLQLGTTETATLTIQNDKRVVAQEKVDSKKVKVALDTLAVDTSYTFEVKTNTGNVYSGEFFLRAKEDENQKMHSPQVNVTQASANGEPVVSVNNIDFYESNDSFGTAYYDFKPDISLSANLGSSSDRDYYKILVPRTTTYKLNLTNIPSGTDYDVKLYNSSYSQIASSTKSSNVNESITVTLEPGNYYIQVYPYSGSSSTNYLLTGKQHDLPVILLPGISGTALHTRDTTTGARDISWLRLFSINEHIRERMLLDNPATAKYQVEVSDDNYGLTAIADIAPETFLFGLEEVYSHIITDLKNKGYVAGKSLFGGGYDWRLNNQTSATRLKARIDQALAASGAEKVILVSHSMGGLVTKSFLTANPTYHSKVDKWITLGTPHLGAGKTTQTFINGYNFDIFFIENSAGLYLASHAPAVYQLMPTEKAYANNVNQGLPTLSYVQNGVRKELKTHAEVEAALSQVHTGAVDSYLDYQESLASLAKSLHTGWNTPVSSIRFYNIVTDNMGTPIGFQYDNNVTSLNQLTNESPKPIVALGDGTVPTGSAIFSATNNTKTYYAKDISHTGLVTNELTRGQVIDIIDGKETPRTGITTGASTTAASFTALSVPFDGQAGSVTLTLASGETATIKLKENDTFEVDKALPGVSVDKYGKNLWLIMNSGKEANVEWNSKSTTAMNVYEITNSKYTKQYKVSGQDKVKSFKIKRTGVEVGKANNTSIQAESIE